jgi:hypothetical protein
MARKLTPARLAVHDFNRALRVWRRVLPSAEILKRLVDERAKALRVGLHSLGLAVVGTLWLAANRPELALKVSLVDIVIPVAYVNFIVAFFYFGSLLQMINYHVLNNLVTVASNKLFKFDGAWALTVLYDSGAAWSAAWVEQFRFFSSSRAHSLCGRIIVLLVNLPVLMVLATGYWIVFSVGVNVVRSEGVFSVPAGFTIAGWLLLLFPVVLSILLCTPFAFGKNVRFIRWNFLCRLYRREGNWPPEVDRWLSQRPV